MWKKIDEFPEEISEKEPLIIITQNNWVHGAYYRQYYSFEKNFDLEDCGGEWAPKQNVKYWCLKKDLLNAIQKEINITNDGLKGSSFKRVRQCELGSDQTV